VNAIGLLLLILPYQEDRITVTFTGSRYAAAKGGTSGSFRTGQHADLVLSGIDFDDAGGPLLFNHPMGIASDGKRLLLADTYNNRVLLWNSTPTSNTPPDLVLGQKDFRSNRSGDARQEMNFPVQVATDGTRVLVADAENHRILIWNRFPTASGVPADRVLRGGDPREPIRRSKSDFLWPWGLWTDGEKLAVSNTRGGTVLIWNRFPSRDDQPADLLLSGGGALGTPRTITSDGRSLIVGDHNPRMGKRGGTFFWRSFPTKDEQPFDFFQEGGHWLRGHFTAERKLLLLGSTLEVWDAFPRDERDRPTLRIRGFDFGAGGTLGSACAGGRHYICAGNRNMMVVYNSLPTRSDQVPDFAVGSPGIHADTLAENFIISNPLPASNGKNLFVASDFDRKLYVWRELPDRSGAHPDVVYRLPASPWDIAVWKQTLALAGHNMVFLWRRLPLSGERPDLVFSDRIGSVRLEEIRGVAMDDAHFYLSERRTGRVHVWKGIPSADSEPAFSLELPDAARLSSDGEWLAVAPHTGHSLRLFRVKDLRSGARPHLVGGRARETFNLVTSAQVDQGRLFAADSASHRVQVWNKVENAISGRPADAILGARTLEDRSPGTARDKLRYPGALSFDGSYLWVGEFKFSERLLRFSPAPR